MIHQELKARPLHSRKIISKLRKDFEAFNILMKERMQLMQEELDELSLINNKELMEGLKKSREDFKEGRFVRCNNKEELRQHLESL